MADLESALTDERHTSLLTQIGRLIVEWNQFEAGAQLMLYGLAGGGHKIDILTAHMGNVSLSDALRTMAAEFAPDRLKEHIPHYLELFDRLRGYRNHYVHSIRLLGFQNGEPVGISESMSAKARLTLHQRGITESEIGDCVAKIREARQYGYHVITVIWRADKDLAPKLGASFLQKPPLPDKLQKPRLFLLDAEPPPQSFRA